MLNEFLFTKIEEENIGNNWFQEEGATFHTAEVTFAVLRPAFEDCIIIWPSRSCYLTPLDYYLWEPSKISVTPTKDNIREVIGSRRGQVSSVSAY